MRYLVGFVWVLALGVMGCSESGPDCAPRGGDCADGSCCPGLFCETFVDSCGVHPDFGKSCGTAPTECPAEEGAYVCGCDGNVYDTECEARQAGVDTGGVCGASLGPVGYFPCGPVYCEAMNYCLFLFTNDSQPEEKNEYRCADLPEACEGISEEAALCECLAEEHWIVDCRSVPGNGVTGIFVELMPI